ncbi:alpha/beta fold hydrolase [Oscillatoria sp. FACHB-1407]|uniref:alpha/beta fold hydrolase n=1 Tax=Oscillatoria sp. FACHB-1407 TaxID=2692847 RepID=UPI001687117F|nr:alpha/beta fold hydrolase [Oscillatoria sp. FACHB-1407]MBD2459468.1 alpha/beta fold hydrolase [Oscillatoria sp. FACHB-1407]
MANEEHLLEVGSLSWFYREALPKGNSDRLPVLLLHGLVSQSYSWREVMPALAEEGFRAIAPDWIGCGYSSKPDRRDFAYTSEAFLEALAGFVDALQLERFHLVAQGFLGSVGIQYALRHPDQVDRLAILNAPVTQTAKLPWRIRQMGIPLVGDMVTQDPLLVDRTLEGGGGYRVEDADLDVYRRPWLKSSDVGRSLLAIVQGLQLKTVTAEIESGLQQWQHPLLLAWGMRDPWLPPDVAKSFAQSIKGTEFVEFDEVGHYPQEDWHEKVSSALLLFFKRRF